MTLCWFLTSKNKLQIISIQYPPHKCLPEKPCLNCLRILIMPWQFTDPVVIMKKSMSWLFKDLIVTAAWINFDQAESNHKNGLKRSNYPNWSFFQRTTHKIFMYILVAFILQFFKNIPRADLELWRYAIFQPKITH